MHLKCQSLVYQVFNLYNSVNISKFPINTNYADTKKLINDNLSEFYCKIFVNSVKISIVLGCTVITHK